MATNMREGTTISHVRTAAVIFGKTSWTDMS